MTQIGAGTVGSYMYRMEWTELVELLLRRRVAAFQDSHLTNTASMHDWRRARAAAEAAVQHAVRHGERVVLVSDVVRQAEEQFTLRLSNHMASLVLKERIASHCGLTTDAVDR
ncbi:hypothetical protein [Streptomyces rishiriensis]|uniref:Uncharacterized protein n=1 Tax=Streptomyces rishiriensis TaxID=68264 RepID=A0ABU0NGH0_STRRH|nr:hypothetical protein [Streptomyces rishiriensis]MDQ0578207.1 hypothetical protein [Streptomyces rishiriensis]